MSGPEPPYRRIAGEIRRRIALGELRPGDPVPSARRITREHGVAIATATKVLALLRDEGLVLTRPGAGTVVAPPRPVTPRARRGPDGAEPELSRERLVRTAMALADAGGLAAVSMRQLAADLGVATMSLYRHVRGRDDLVLAMADTALADAPLPAVPPAGWRARLELLARGQWAVYRRHRWLPHVISMSRPQPLPKGMAHTEWALRATAGLGLDTRLRWHFAVTLMAYVRGIATNLEAQAHAEQDTGLTDEQWVETHDAMFQRLMTGGRYPTMAALDEAVDLDLDSVFEFGLHRLLDGYAALIDPPRAG
ncbi:TetR/AcrR family transcriptional regulator C-terminal domain-containing protein [Micromonospora sp. DR5-3]|uniref:TetR/AcrR family transcriptional regulator C-terminal domain-containing protein n=1 Tax=unclassified Micromonospora TaxID=2617518 RepID=UPI0011DA9349|nr:MULTISPECIES: TetR/AcrR family transcriptional regulator C-terminal domain-containing protein [unclassified Micromonospora]MCW3819687.1 TetR/AcrR family transcriptional regulator C-terminal domain-containing protein [Micromonospora sp. DR5-3]TYC20431.1 GntR family transcriptional regulator [Micromonospora sp. MP36]